MITKPDYREKLAGAVADMIDEKCGITKLSRLTSISRATIYKIRDKKQPTIRIDQLYKLMEHGMELNSIQVFLDRIKREGALKKKR